MANVLGLSIGTRSMGFAILENGKLLDWRLKSYTGTWSRKKLVRIVRIVEKTIDRNGISEIAVKVPDVLPVSKGYMQLIGALNVLFEHNRTPTVYFHASDLKLHYCKSANIDTEMLVQAIRAEHPELYINDKREAKSKRYYQKVYEAFAAAYILTRS